MLMTRLIRDGRYVLDLLANKLKSRCIILVHSHVDTINTRTTHEFQEVTRKSIECTRVWYMRVSSLN